MTLRRLIAGLMLGAAVAPAVYRLFEKPDTADEAKNLSSTPEPIRPPEPKIVYPAARTQDQADTYHGVTVPDLYRWLEDANSLETKAWVDAENQITADYLNAIPARARILERLTQVWDYEKYGLPFREGSRYFFTRNNGLQNQSVLFVTDSLAESETPRVLLDPNTLSADGTVALSGLAVSESGEYLAYGLASAGSDWQEWRIRDVATGDDLPDHLRWVKFSGASWTKDNTGFFYSRYDAPSEETALQETNYYHKLYFHRMGESQEQDTLIYDRPDQKDWNISGDVTEDGAYLIIYTRQGTERKNRVFYKPLANPDAPIAALLDAGDAEYGVIGNDGSVFYIRTDRDAPRGRVIALDSETSNEREILSQQDDVLQGVRLFGNQMLAVFLHDAHTQVRIYDLGGNSTGEIALPGIGSAGGFGGKRTDTETFYSFTGYTTPATIYRYDITTGKSTVFKQPQVRFDPDAYETTQVFYYSNDGTRIPMFLTHRKDIVLDGTNPTYLYGYGGFNVSLTPYFSPAVAVWLAMGGVYAVANLRGGGEYGKEWHDAGKKLAKQNVFDDFIAAGEWLIQNQYTRTSRLAIAGGSNGGLLVGAAMTQRPELWGAALPAVGVMDMLRFNKFTIGWAWMSDYGNPDENPDDFAALFAYSPLHNLKAGTHYPPTLITTSDHDDRVVPAHSYKFAAMLQAAQGGNAPVLIRIETQAGHGAGKPTAKILEEVSDIYGFLTRALNFDLPKEF